MSKLKPLSTTKMYLLREMYLLWITFLLFVLDFIFEFVNSFYGIHIFPAGIAAFILLIPLSLKLIYNSAFNWRGRGDTLQYYLFFTLSFLIIINHNYYNPRFPDWIVMVVLLTIFFGKLIYIFTKKSTLIKNSDIFFQIFLVALFLMFFVITFSENKSPVDYLVLLKYLLFFAFGYYFFFVSGHRVVLNKLILVFFILLSLFVVFNTFLIETVIRGSGVNYLRLAESFVFISIYLMVVARNKMLLHMTFFVSSIILALIGSRSAFFFFILVFFVFILFKFRLKYFIKTILGYLAMITGFLVIGVRLFLPLFMNIVDGITKSAILKILLIPEQDSSLIARIKYLLKGFHRIRQSLIMGDFKGELEYGVGTYVHNIISYFSQFGIFVFILILCLMVMSGYFLIKNFKEIKNYHRFYFVFIYFLYCMLLMIFAKAYIYFNLYIAFGMVFALMKEIEGSREK